jgi:predicted nucleic acid-binding protein
MGIFIKSSTSGKGDESDRNERGWVFASDHPPVRNFARVRKIRLTGTLGILVKAAKASILSVSEADSIHARIINHGYRSPLSPINGVSSFLNR